MLVPKALYQGQPTATVATLYTVPANTDTVVTEILAANTTGGPVSLTLHKVPNGGTPSAANMILPAVTINGNSILTLSLGTVLDTAGDTIRGLASIAAAITLTMSGYEETP